MKRLTNFLYFCKSNQKINYPKSVIRDDYYLHF